MIKLLNDFICTLVRCNIQLVRAYPTSKPTTYIDRTILAGGRHPMYDELDRGPTSGRRVGIRRQVRWLWADVGPTHWHPTSGTMVVGRRRADASASNVGYDGWGRRRANASAADFTYDSREPTSGRCIGTDEAHICRTLVKADVWPTCGRYKVTHHNI